MKHLLPIFLFLFLGTAVSGQVLTTNPSVVDTTFTVDLATAFIDLVAPAQITNNTDDTLLIRWERNIIELPQGWEAKVCDQNLCYTNVVDSNIDEALALDEPVIIPPRATDKLDIHFVPFGTAGTAKVEIELATVEEPNNLLAVIEYRVEVVGTTTSVRRTLRSRPLIYPNPSGDYLKVRSEQAIERLIIYNLVGRSVKSFKATQNSTYDISDLSSGIYLVGLYNKNGELIKTERISKRNIAP